MNDVAITVAFLAMCVGVWWVDRHDDPMASDETDEGVPW